MEQEAMVMAQQGLASMGLYISIGLVMVGVGLIALGMSSILKTLVTEVSRNPGIKDDLFRFALIGVALVEMLALSGVVAVFILLFK